MAKLTKVNKKQQRLLIIFSRTLGNIKNIQALILFKIHLKMQVQFILQNLT